MENDNISLPQIENFHYNLKKARQLFWSGMFLILLSVVLFLLINPDRTSSLIYIVCAIGLFLFFYSLPFFSKANLCPYGKHNLTEWGDQLVGKLKKCHSCGRDVQQLFN